MEIRELSTAINHESELTAEVGNFVELVKNFKVNSPETLTFALQTQKDIRTFVKFSNEWFKPEKRKWDAEKEKVLIRERATVDPLIAGDKYLGELISDYNSEQRRKEAEQARLLELENTKRADLEKKALLEQAEQEKKAGNTETAKTLFELSNNVNPAPAIIPQSIPSSIKRNDGGTSSIGIDYDVTIVKEREFLLNVAGGKIPMSAIKVDLVLRDIKKWISENKVCPEGGAVVIHGLSIKEKAKTTGR